MFSNMEFFFYGLEVLNLQTCSHVGDHGPYVECKFTMCS